MTTYKNFFLPTRKPILTCHRNFYFEKAKYIRRSLWRLAWQAGVKGHSYQLDYFSWGLSKCYIGFRGPNGSRQEKPQNITMCFGWLERDQSTESAPKCGSTLQFQLIHMILNLFNNICLKRKRYRAAGGHESLWTSIRFLFGHDITRLLNSQPAAAPRPEGDDNYAKYYVAR